MSLDRPEFEEKNTQEKQSKLNEKVDLPQERKEQVNVQVKEELNILSNQKLQTISHQEFLEFSDDAKLQSISRNISGEKFTTQEIISGEISDIKFLFSFEKDEIGNEPINRKLWLKTTAGQVMPNAVSKIMCEWKEYSRNNLEWEFFTQEGKRLLIHHNTHIQITEIRSEEQIQEIAQKNDEKTQEFLKENTQVDKKIASESIKRWFDPNFIMKIFAWLFIDFWKMTWAMQEDAFTQIDREIGKINQSWINIDKNNLDEFSQAKIEKNITNKQNIENNEFWDFPELDALAKQMGIVYPEFLYAIWQNESSCGTDVDPRHESRGRTSYGMFQILNTNLTWEWEKYLTVLKKNPFDVEANIWALRHFIENNPALVSAINNQDYYQVASIYNGRWFETLANKNWWTPYDEKLKNAVSHYRSQFSEWNLAA